MLPSAARVIVRELWLSQKIEMHSLLLLMQIVSGWMGEFICLTVFCGFRKARCVTGSVPWESLFGSSVIGLLFCDLVISKQFLTARIVFKRRVIGGW